MNASTQNCDARGLDDRPPAASRKSIARRAGLLYLLACLPAPFALVYLPTRVLVAGDMTATADRIRTYAGLLRVGMVVEAWSCLVMVFVAFALYRLFHDVGRKLAAATAVLMWIAVPMQLMGLVFTIGAVTLATTPAFLEAFSKDQVDALAYLLFRLHARGIEVTQILWGLWLFPWGLAAIRSGFIPRWIGAVELVAGSGYLLASTILLAMPQLAAVVPAAMALGMGELPMGLWLLIWGVREPRPDAT
jgi:hypothetical protein